jgi:hypothetical protein
MDAGHVEFLGRGPVKLGHSRTRAGGPGYVGCGQAPSQPLIACWSSPASAASKVAAGRDLAGSSA